MLWKDRLSSVPALGGTFDAEEVARFDKRAREWWNPDGKFAVIHAFNAVRRDYVVNAVARHFGRPVAAARPLEGLRLLDIGCGAGVLAEPMAQNGADVVAIDASAMSIDVARRHAESSGLDIDYRHCLAEDLVAAGDAFDVVLNAEVVEHVADQPLFLRQSATLTAPGGLHLTATLNRTIKAWALAIFGAEYVLRWLPRGTHAWSKFVGPTEVEAAFTLEGLNTVETVGVGYDVLRRRWKLTTDTSVNYMMLSQRPQCSDGAAVPPASR